MTRPPALPHPARFPTRRLAACVSALALCAAISACDPQSDGDAGASTGCESTVRQASLASEVADQVRLLDDALLTCRSYDRFTDELDRYPGIVGYDISTFVALRCDHIDDEAIRRAPTCAAVIDPTTTLPPTTLPDIVFVGDTLDGRRIEIRPSATVQFVGDVPATVQQTVDIAFESGCEGVLSQRDLWATRAGDPVTGDEASVYAQHAQNVANYIQCVSEPIDLTSL